MTLQEAVDQLPTTADEIAELMRHEAALGAYGCIHCPLAIWLRKQTGAVVNVTHHYCRIDGVPTDYVELPSAASDFVQAFDAGKHPELFRSWGKNP